MRDASADPGAAGHLGPRIGLGAVALLVLAAALLLPFAVRSALADLVAPASPRLYRLGPPQQPAAQHVRIHLTVTALDVVEQTATILVTAYQVCPAACVDTYELLLVSAFAEGRHDEGVPPSASVTIPARATETSDTVHLPLLGTPIRYPFDTYELAFGAVMQHRLGDGSMQALTPAAAEGRVFLTLQSKVQGLDTSAPRTLSAERIPVVGSVYPFLVVSETSFARPFYLPVLTVLLVLLVVVAAAYAVFVQPVGQLVVNVGALMLGIWGVRSILVGAIGPTVSAVDLALSLVILFLLLAIAVRWLSYLYARSGLRLLPRLHVLSPAAERPTTQDEPETAAPPTPAAERRRR